MTGRKFTDTHGIDSIEHLQVMKVGIHKILFCAEVDAVTNDGCPTEITTSNWIQNKLFQMVSNGSPTLCFGLKQNESLVSVQMMTLSAIAELERYNLATWTKNILSGLDILKKADFAFGEGFSVRFEGADICLERVIGDDLLPQEAILNELLLD